MPSASHSFQIALLLLIAVLWFPKPATAQVDIKIIVDGPWAYVADPDAPQTRIFVIAPVERNHSDAEIYPKPSGHSGMIPTGKYNLEIVGFDLKNCDDTPSKAFPYALKDISPDAIKKAISSTNQRYAFSVPKPCYYREADNKFSKISPTPINTPADQVKGDPYTTTMELHYLVPTVTAAKLTGKSDKGTTYNDAVDLKNNYIQFIMSAGLLTQNDEQQCDSTSAASFLATVKLFGEKRYVWFPMLNPLGNQIKDFFQENCQKDNTREALLTNMQTASAALNDIEIIEQYIVDPKAHGQQTVLEALTRLSGAVESLKTADTLPKVPGSPARPEISVVREELERAKAFILNKQSSKIASKDQTAAEEIKPPRLLNAYRYVVFSAAGSADCHGAQVGVNGP
jgi:hypothetical protein